ncbi:immunoglobulin iota chain-like [Cinclus cinclus]|uniref:immunoglobulin iota chain-like n=1 Tax=Cinclus cinclus TaxID=127875 RepID=UPI002E134BB6
MRRGRGAGLAALAAVLLVASGRAQVQQDPFLETTEGISINISCSHPSKVSGDYIHFYRQLPGQSPEFLALTARGSKDVPGIGGKLLVSEDGRSSALWLGRPRRGDAAVYYCALGPRAEEPGLRPGTNRRGRGRAGPGAHDTRRGIDTGTDTGPDNDTETGSRTDTYTAIGTSSSHSESPTTLSPSSHCGFLAAQLLTAASSPARPQLHVLTDMVWGRHGGQ